MKYEYIYSGCFDYMFFDVFPDQNILRFFEDEWGMVAIDSETMRCDLFALIEKWHETGVIVPLDDTNAKFIPERSDD